MRTREAGGTHEAGGFLIADPRSRGDNMTNEQIKDFTLRVTQANHSELMVILFDVESVYLKDSIVEFEAGNTEEFIKNMELARKAHNELMSGVNEEDKAGRNMLGVLRYIYKLLTASTIKRKPQEIDRVLGMLEKLKECFVAIKAVDDPSPVMKNTHQVYAGLTYGRGTLNESVSMDNYSSRGFTV